MSTILFDTLRLSRTLRDKGNFTTEQADAIAEALGEAAHGDLATKSDLKTEIAEAKTDILKWIIGAIGFQTIVILGAIVSLIKVFGK
ncbi:MAG: hypothetical protein WDN46_05220 [Methylocella sp.]